MSKEFNSEKKSYFNREGSSNQAQDEHRSSKRPRITRTQETAANDGGGERERRSFNPNFNKNNRPFNSKSGGNGKFNKFKKKGEMMPKGGFDSESKPTAYPTFDAAPINEPLRLNKFISMSGVCSRREADAFISNGLVSVNGVVITELGSKVNPTDEVVYNGATLRGEKKVYILMNKPKGFVTTVDDPNADRTVMDIVKNACKERVYPVGRLDKNSLGVLLITNDGELTKRLTHPSYNKQKIYQVAIDKNITTEDMERMCEGIGLDDGIAIADEVSCIGDTRREVGVTIHSGKNRIVRRMFEAMDYKVIKLDRVYFGGLTKKGLRRGAWRYLTTKEVTMLQTGRYE